VKKFVVTAFCIPCLLFQMSCSNDSTADLIDNSTVETVTYTENIKDIIDTNCLACHGIIPSFGATISLSSYENVKDAVLNRGLIDRISRPEGSSGAMPLSGPKLPSNKINFIIQWQSQNFQP
jgi:hypothetical protein